MSSWLARFLYELSNWLPKPFHNRYPCVSGTVVLGGYTSSVGFAIIFVFYYFAVILLGGAEVNAFYAQGKRALPDNLAGMVHDFTHGLPKDEEEVQEKQGT